MIELRLLRYFLAVAETEHVGKAAARLHISQSPLSRQIRQLEDLLGVELFHREKQRIRITEAGTWLLKPAREMVARADALVRDAQQRSEGDAGQIAVGFVGAALASGPLPRVLRRLRRARPQVQVRLRQAGSVEQVARLRAGELDLALVHRAPAGADLASVLLAEQPYVLATPRRSPLARGPVRAKQLDGQPWIAVASDAYRERWAAAWDGAGFAPDVVVHVVEWGSALALVDAGLGLAIVPASYAAGAPRGVALRRLPWLKLLSKLWLVRRAGAHGRLLDDVCAWLAAPTPRR